MSDIGLNFSALDILGAGAIIALPVTTILLVILGALRLGARGSTQRRGRRWVLNAGIIGVAPLWAIGAGILAWLLVDDLIEECTPPAGILPSPGNARSPASRCRPAPRSTLMTTAARVSAASGRGDGHNRRHGLGR